ncbi:MAG: phosphatidate cytidylyltransferase [Candidatus Hydrogenedentes bacterium]|nr:phosphatidate cytidylyltransferase [Candidatus Hydrogenedentota bacterium]
MGDNALRTRVLTAVAILSVVLSLIWVPRLEFVFALVVTGLAAYGLREYHRMVEHRQIETETVGGIIIGAAVTFSGCFHHQQTLSLALYGGCAAVAILHIVRGQYSLAGLACSVFGVLYIGWFGGHVLLLRGIPRVGAGLVTMTIAVVALTDAAAYIVGSMFGKHRMAPTLSPKKSWEGAIGGFVAALAGMIVIYILGSVIGWHAFPAWSLKRYLVIGALLSVAGQAGDLAESAMKRAAGVKDSGTFFPGHGGVLDRADSYLFAAPLAYYLVAPLFHQ